MIETKGSDQNITHPSIEESDEDDILISDDDEPILSEINIDTKI